MFGLSLREFNVRALRRCERLRAEVRVLERDVDTLAALVRTQSGVIDAHARREVPGLVRYESPVVEIGVPTQRAR